MTREQKSDNQPATRADIRLLDGKIDATKTDIRRLDEKIDTVKTELRSEIQGMGTQLRSEIQGMGTQLRSEMQGMGVNLYGEIAKLQRRVERIEERMSTKDDINRVINAIDAFAGEAKDYRRKDAERGHMMMKQHDKLEDHETRLQKLEAK